VRREIIWLRKLYYFLFVRAALKGRHTLDRGATPGMNKTNKISVPRGAQQKKSDITASDISHKNLP